MLEFASLEPASVQVRIAGKQYTVQEASAGDAYEYRNAVLRCRKYDNEGNVTDVDGLPRCEAVLVSRCLRSPDGGPVPFDTVLAWPSAVTNSLFRLAEELSDLDQNETEESLQRSIEKLQSRLARLQARKNGRSAQATPSA